MNLLMYEGWAMVAQNHSPCVYYLQYLLNLPFVGTDFIFLISLRIKFVVPRQVICSLVTDFRPDTKLCS